MSGGKRLLFRALATAKAWPLLRTATGGHPAGVSVRTADVVLTACRTNVAGLPPGMMEPCRSASERRSAPA